MANHERYPHAHRDLESVSAARAFLGPHGELISARLAYALAPPKPMPAQAERGVSADGRDPLERALTHLAEVRSKRSRQVEARVAAAARTARRLITEITRLATVVSEVEEQVARELEEEGFDGESTLVLAVFDALARRDREGIPFGIPSKAEFDALSSVLGDFVERTGAKTKRKRRPGQSKRSESFDPFDLTVALALLEEEGVCGIKPKQLAAAEVIATGKSKPNVTTAAAAVRKWELALSKARQDVPTVLGWFEERRNAPAK